MRKRIWGGLLYIFNVYCSYLSKRSCFSYSEYALTSLVGRKKNYKNDHYWSYKWCMNTHTSFWKLHLKLFLHHKKTTGIKILEFFITHMMGEFSNKNFLLFSSHFSFSEFLYPEYSSHLWSTCILTPKPTTTTFWIVVQIFVATKVCTFAWKSLVLLI